MGRHYIKPPNPLRDPDARRRADLLREAAALGIEAREGEGADALAARIERARRLREANRRHAAWLGSMKRGGA